MNHPPRRVSIVMTTYNGARFLNEQLASFTAQTRLPDELVVGDDGSTDGTLSLLEEFAKTAPFRVTIHRNPENLGYARNFCETMQRCSGDIIFLSDQDDSWMPDKIARCIGALEQPGALLVTHDARLADGELRPTDATMFGQLRASGSTDPDALFYGCCMAFDRLLVDFVLPPPLHFHDMWLAVVARHMAGRVFIDDPLILYRRHGSNASTSHVTSTRRASAWRRMANRWRDIRGTSARTELSEAVYWAESMVNAFRRNADQVTRQVGPQRYAAILIDVEADLARALERLRIHTGKAFSRPLRVARFAWGGGYRHNASLLSVLRDLAG